MILSGLFDKRAAVIGGSHPSAGVSWLSSSSDTFAGVNVTPDNALAVEAVWAAVRVGSESVASPSLDLYKRLDGGGKETERDHPASWLLRQDANEETGSFVFKEAMQGYVETWGNAFAEIDFDKGGRPIGLSQRGANRVLRLERKAGGKLFYEVTPTDGGTPRDVPADKMLHVKAFGGSGLWGLSPVTTLREMVARNKAHGRYRSASFGERMQMNGFLKHPSPLNPEAKENLVADLEAAHKGANRAFRTAVLDEGMDWEAVGFPPDSMQMLESGIFGVQEVARCWRIPPHILMELSHGTFTNIEHQGIEFVQFSILPRTQRWVDELNRKLLTKAERMAGLFFEFNLDTFLRGDFETRQSGLSAAVGSGRMTPNEGRSLDNMNPVEGGDDLWVPLNWKKMNEPAPPVRAVTERSMPDGTREVVTEFDSSFDQRDLPPHAEPTCMCPGCLQWAQRQRPECRETARDLPPASQRSAESRWLLRDVFEKLLAVAGSRIVTAEVKAIRREISRLPTVGIAQFRLWLEDFFERHAAFATEVAAPVLLAMFEAMSAEALSEVGGDKDDFRADLEAFHAEYADAFGRKTAAIGQSQVERQLRIADTDDAAMEAIGEMLDGWEEHKAGQIALSTSTDGMGAVSTAAYAFAGVTTLRWVWNGGECKICPNLHGKVVAIGQPFVRKGDRVGDPDEVTPMEIKKVRNYPGLHGGCVCTVAPG